ncbi:MAG: hypothetical protein PHS54_03230 [Clostridia bacterium]|nr:hypothetical protein [Clostridia bacterium]
MKVFNTIRNGFDKLKTNLLKIKKNQKIIVFGCACFSLLLLIPAGDLSSDTKKEYYANQLAEVVKNQTNDGECLSLYVESFDEAENPLYSSVSEFNSLYGIFNENRTTFAGMINSNKSSQIIIDDIDTNQNLSILYTEFNSNVEYNNHYKHEYYPIELMFKGDFNYSGAYSFVYISQSQADILLEKQGKLDEHIVSDYESLISSHINISFNDVTYVYSIADIYLEENYYYETIQNVFGNFVISSNTYPQGFNKQACYFFNTFSFQNEYFMDYINKNYDETNYSLNVCEHNIRNEFTNENELLNFFYNRNVNIVGNFFSIMLFVFSLLILLVSIYLLKIYGIYKKKKNIILGTVFLFSPYLIFKLIYSIFDNVFIFPSLSMLIYLFFIVLFIAFYFAFFFSYYNTDKHIERKL